MTIWGRTNGGGGDKKFAKTMTLSNSENGSEYVFGRWWVRWKEARPTLITGQLRRDDITWKVRQLHFYRVKMRAEMLYAAEREESMMSRDDIIPLRIIPINSLINPARNLTTAFTALHANYKIVERMIEMRVKNSITECAFL